MTKKQIAESLHISVRTMEYAAKVMKQGIPELKEVLRKGEIAGYLAAFIADLPQEDQLWAMENKNLCCKGIREGLRERRSRLTTTDKESLEVVQDMLTQLAQLIGSPGQEEILQEGIHEVLNIIESLLKTSTKKRK